MPGTGTNDFAIKNPSALSSTYKLYGIRGLSREVTDDRHRNDYYLNCQYLIRTLSFRLQQPVTVIERDNAAFLVVPADVAFLPASLPLVRGREARFDPLPETFSLDYTRRTPENDTICLRFLEFLIQAPLYGRCDLWQPNSGAAFFPKSAEGVGSETLHYRGFSVRPVIAPDGGIALRVHIANKYVSRRALPAHLHRNECERWKKKHFIYHYGHRWYEIRAEGLSDFNATEYRVTTKDGRRPTLLEFAAEESKKPIPLELSRVEHDCSVLLYYNNRAEERGALSGLCYRVYGPHDVETKKLHSHSIQPAGERRSMAVSFARRYLSRLNFGDTTLEIETEPLAVPTRTFTMPDFRFGNSQILTVRGTPGAIKVALEGLGVARLNLLKDAQAGFHNAAPLGRQYFVVPVSVLQSWGESFLKALGNQVDGFLHQEDSYRPIVVPYNDRLPKTFLAQGRSILKAVEEMCDKPGHGCVMIHTLPQRRSHEEDQLAAMVVRELRKRYDLTAAVIHTDTGQQCYVLGKESQGEPLYVPQAKDRGRLSGYVQLVALNKVLLLNERWPFVLATPLHADLTVGIDVKYHTAGLVLVDRYGEKIRPILRDSKQKERLREDQIEAYLLELIRAEAAVYRSAPLRVLVIQRDGHVWPSESTGIRRAFERLKREGTLSADATLTVLEIPKSSPSPFRLFAMLETAQEVRVDNPQIGQYEIRGNDGYLCTTGRAFPHRGTVLPLHVRKLEGPLPLDHCLEDTFFLSALAWTKPDDCARDPITAKLNDRYLSDQATRYDAEALEYGLSTDDSDEEAFS